MAHFPDGFASPQSLNTSQNKSISNSVNIQLFFRRLEYDNLFHLVRTQSIKCIENRLEKEVDVRRKLRVITEPFLSKIPHSLIISYLMPSPARKEQKYSVFFDIHDTSVKQMNLSLSTYSRIIDTFQSNKGNKMHELIVECEDNQEEAEIEFRKDFNTLTVLSGLPALQPSLIKLNITHVDVDEALLEEDELSF